VPTQNDEPTHSFTSRALQPSWIIVALLFVVALINYFDRQSLSVVAPLVQQQLHLSDSGYGHLVSLFLLASTFSYALSGMLSDRLGSRKSMALFVGWWSIAEAATAFTTSTIQLGFARFCLGLGEPGLWVVAPKAVGELFRDRQRALAIGIYTLGATVGAVVAIPVITLVTSHLPWRWIFLIDGSAGLLWLPLWLLITRRISGHTATVPSIIVPSAAPPSASIRRVITEGKTWRLLIARGITDPVWYFYLFWFPKYLLGTRHLSLAQLTHQGWIVYLAAGTGTLFGGTASGALIRRGATASDAYRRTMLFSALLVPLSPIVTIAPSAFFAILIASVIAFAHMVWLVNLTSTVVELFPSAQVGTAAGLIAAGSGFGGMISSEIVGYVVSHYGYTPLFFLMALLHPLAITICWSVFSPKPSIVSSVA
jgi:ACS family hexuronate transporter-like MFS transporter